MGILKDLAKAARAYAKSHNGRSKADKQERLRDSVALAVAIEAAEEFSREHEDIFDLLTRSLGRIIHPKNGVNHGVEQPAT